MNIDHFDDLLTMARAQPTAQHLLLVFARAELPDDATEAQRQAFEAGEGGALAPVFCVPRPVADLKDFEALRAEASAMGADWDMVFAAALSARPGQVLTGETIDQALDQMVAAVAAGQIHAYLPFDPTGLPVHLG